jgi:hypothetical protein
MESDQVKEPKQKEIKTLVSDDCYERLFSKASKAKDKTFFERFEGDKNKTKIWIDKFGKLMSHMPPEPFMKEIITISKVQKEEPTMQPNNARGDMLLKLLQKGMNNEDAVNVSQMIYKKVPLDKYASDELIDNIYKGYFEGGLMLELNDELKNFILPENTAN